MKFSKSIFLMFASFSLSACVAFNPIPKGYTGPTSTIVDTYSNDEGNSAHYFVLTQVNGKIVESSFGATRSKFYGRGQYFDPVMVTREVLPEPATFTIEGYKFFPTDAQLLFGDTMSVKKEFKFKPVENMTYYVKGKLDDNGSQVWLEDAQGSVITESQ